MNANHEVIRQVLGGGTVEHIDGDPRNNDIDNLCIHPAEREGSSLDDVYTALTDAISAVTDLTILAGRHLPTSLTRKAERALAGLLELRDTVMPAASEGGPF